MLLTRDLRLQDRLPAGLTGPPGEDQRPAAGTEGWIAIPEGSSLDRLV